MEKNNREIRINELINELNECREDERNSQNQIVQLIATAGTILGILLGASYFNDPNKNTYINQTSIFILSNFVFCTVFPYVVVLGIVNVMRYYYVQSLEDRLFVLIPHCEDDDRMQIPFVHWGSFIASIVTRNTKNIKSLHTMLHYICYSLAAIFAVLFSAGVTLLQFYRIDNKEWYHYILLFVPIILMLMALALFCLANIKTCDIAQFARETAVKKRLKRLITFTFKENRNKIKNKLSRKNIKYLIYPRISDIQKPILIILGFIGYIWKTQTDINAQVIVKLFISIVIFDFLAYQARYQINDLRGLDEDLFAQKKGRLADCPYYNLKTMIKLSRKVAIIRIVLAVLLTVLFDKILNLSLKYCLLVLLVSTILYENARKKQRTGIIYLMVGVGYPLRIVVGILAANTRNVFEIVNQVGIITTVLFLLAFWAFGIYSSVISWVKEVLNGMFASIDLGKANSTFTLKNYFLDIEKSLRKRFEYINSLECDHKKVRLILSKSIPPDTWHKAFFFAMFFLFLIFVNMKHILVLDIFYLILYFLAAFVIGCKKSFHGINMCYFLLLLTLMIKAVVGVYCWGIFDGYIVLTFIQTVFILTYIIIVISCNNESPDVKAWIYKCTEQIIIKLLGETVWKILYQKL